MARVADKLYDIHPSAHGCEIRWRRNPPERGAPLEVTAANQGGPIKSKAEAEVKFKAGTPIVLGGLIPGTDYILTVDGPGVEESATFRTQGDPPVHRRTTDRSGPRDRSPSPVS